MAVNGASQAITAAVVAWEGIHTVPHRFGGVEFQLGTREIGHLHGDHMLDIPFPKTVRNTLVTQGLAQPHHILPDTGWVSFYIRQPDDIARAVDLLRRSYELARSQKSPRSGAATSQGETDVDH